jgi:MscS family membrane protein
MIKFKHCQRACIFVQQLFFYTSVVFLAALLATGNVTAQPALKEVATEQSTTADERKPPPEVVVPLGPEDEFDRGLPRTSVKRFLEFALAGDYESAAQHLDLRNLPDAVKKIGGPELARQLKIILDRALWIDLDLLSDHPRGYENDGLPSYRDLLGQIETDKRTYTLLLQRVPRGDGQYIWKISNATVARIPELFELADYGPFGEFLSRIVPHQRLFGADLWQWVGVVLIMIFAYLVLLPPMWLAKFLINRKKSDNGPQIIAFVKGPLRLLLWVLICSAMIDLVSPTVAMRAIIKAYTLFTIAGAWILVRLFDFYIEYQIQRLEQQGRHSAVVLLQPVTTVVRGLIILAALIIWLDNIGFKVTTLLAGLGVGGIAIALAAQAIFADLIGTVILLVSQPVRVGDFCRFGAKMGVVEEIGVRSTRVRTLDDTVVSIPNAEFSKLQLENFALRKKVWFHPQISLPYETSQEQVQTIITEMESLLRNHPDVLDEPVQIHFTNISDYALVLDVFSYVNTGDYGEYKKIAEQLNLGIMAIIEKAGSRLALPARKLFLEETGKREGVSSSPAE